MYTNGLPDMQLIERFTNKLSTSRHMTNGSYEGWWLFMNVSIMLFFPDPATPISAILIVGLKSRNICSVDKANGTIN